MIKYQHFQTLHLFVCFIYLIGTNQQQQLLLRGMSIVLTKIQKLKSKAKVKFVSYYIRVVTNLLNELFKLNDFTQSKYFKRPLTYNKQPIKLFKHIFKQDTEVKHVCANNFTQSLTYLHKSLEHSTFVFCYNATYKVSSQQIRLFFWGRTTFKWEINLDPAGREVPDLDVSYVRRSLKFVLFQNMSALRFNTSAKCPPSSRKEKQGIGE